MQIGPASDQYVSPLSLFRTTGVIVLIKNIKSMTLTLITVFGIIFLYNKNVLCNNRNQPGIPTIFKLQYILIIDEVRNFLNKNPKLHVNSNLILTAVYRRSKSCWSGISKNDKFTT